jgi:hypothetical protein
MERAGEIGGRPGQHVGRVAHLDAALPRRLHVDVVKGHCVVGARSRGSSAIVVRSISVGEQAEDPFRGPPAIDQLLTGRRIRSRPNIGLVAGSQLIQRVAGKGMGDK